MNNIRIVTMVKCQCKSTNYLRGDEFKLKSTFVVKTIVTKVLSGDAIVDKLEILLVKLEAEDLVDTFVEILHEQQQQQETEQLF